MLAAKGLPTNPDAERFLLGSILLDSQQYALVAGLVQADDFSLEKHRRIFRRLGELDQRGEKIDRITLANELMKHNELDSCDGLTYLVSLDDGLPQIPNLDAYCKIVREKATLRRAIFACQGVINRCLLGEEGATDILAEAERVLQNLQEGHSEPQGWIEIGKVPQSTSGGLNAILCPSPSQRGASTPWSRLDRTLCGLKPGELVIVAGRPSMGKAQPLSSLILTTCGWKSMGEIEIGDDLVSPDGKRSIVIARHPQPRQQIYRITFSDGRSTECTGEHLWRVHRRDWKEKYKTFTTAELILKLRAKRNYKRISIPLPDVRFRPVKVKIHPWVLGLLLGDGCLCNHISFTSADAHIVRKMERNISPYGLKVSVVSGKYQYSIVQSRPIHKSGVFGPLPNVLQEKLKSMGLWGTDCFTKFIPEEYLKNSRRVRMEVLRGLLDSDGTVGLDGAISLTTVSRRLAEGAQELVRSLGGWCKIIPRRKRHQNQNGYGAVSFHVSIRHPRGHEFFSLPRKQILACNRRYRPSLTITSIDPVREEEAQCITVSHPDGLYITDNFIVTHNSIVGMQLAYHAAEEKRGAAVISLEMSKVSLFRRTVAAIGSVDAHRMQMGTLTPEERRRASQAAQSLSDAPLWIDDSRARTIPQILSAVRKLAMRYPLQLLVVDHLQLMLGLGKRENRREEISDITHAFSHLSKDMGITVVLLSQLNRKCEEDQRRPQLSDLKECGTIEEDADVVLFVHREEQYRKRDPALRGKAEFIVAKHRNGPTGLIPMLFQHGYQRFVEPVEDHDGLTRSPVDRD